VNSENESKESPFAIPFFIFDFLRGEFINGSRDGSLQQSFSYCSHSSID